MAFALGALEQVAQRARSYEGVTAARALLRTQRRDPRGADFIERSVLAMSEEGMMDATQALLASQCMGGFMAGLVQMADSYAILVSHAAAARVAFMAELEPYQATGAREAVLNVTKRLREMSADELRQAIMDASAAVARMPRTSQLGECQAARAAFMRFVGLAAAVERAWLLLTVAAASRVERAEFFFEHLDSATQEAGARAALVHALWLVQMLINGSAYSVTREKRLLLPCETLATKRLCSACGRRVLMLDREAPPCANHDTTVCLGCHLEQKKDAAPIRLAPAALDEAWRDFMTHFVTDGYDDTRELVTALAQFATREDNGCTGFCATCFAGHCAQPT